MTDGFYGLFELDRTAGAAIRLVAKPRHNGLPFTVPCPDTGLPLKVASVEVSERGVCPACTQAGAGGYVSFESDLRLAFACPACRRLVWIPGA